MIRPEQLRMARAGLGWTLNDLAERAGVNPNTISRYEVGRDVLSGTLLKIEIALHDAGVTFVDDKQGLGVLIGQSADRATRARSTFNLRG